MLGSATRAAAYGASSLRPVFNAQRQRLLLNAQAVQTGRTYASSSNTPPPQNPQNPQSSSKDEASKDSPSSSSSIPEQSSDPAAATPSKNRSTSAFDIDTTLMAIADDAADGKDSSGRTGARARSDAQQSSIERQRKTTRRIFALMGLAGAGVMLGNLSREFDTVEERKRFQDNPASSSPFGRIKLRLQADWQDWNAPKWEKLLPDPLPFPYQRPYTLVVDMDELLIHSHWTREHGWRTAKRPGLDYFLGYLSQWYEIVLYTTQPYYISGPIIEKLDPDRRFITYTLFKESCRNHEGKTVKDLSALNRDLSKVVILDTEAERFSLQPENGILVKKWDGNRSDRELMGLVDFFEAVGIYAIPDVRQTIQSFAGTHVPTEHARRVSETKRKQLEEWQSQQGSSSSSLSKSWFGGFKGQSPPPSEGGGPPKTWYETERERFQQGYAEDLKYWKENGESIRNQAKEEQERQLKEMKLSAWGMLTGAGMRPPEAPGQSS
ncbi:unnamed protein product [Sympodiomycopsis kandeliae]